MPRANRNFLPGYVWHITQRCHKREFLLKFKRDRHRWLRWLFEAKKRFKLTILNYIVTSNHIHLLAVSNTEDDIANGMQLVSGRVAQEYNNRKKRSGAFWQDRYHATAVDSDGHLLRCLSYIDMNMIRAGVVAHPGEWDVTAYHEIFSPRERYRTVDLSKLMVMFKCKNLSSYRKKYHKYLTNELALAKQKRDPVWTEAIAVGSKMFCEEIRTKLDPSKRYKKLEIVEYENFTSLMPAIEKSKDD